MSTATNTFRPALWLALATVYLATFAVIMLWPRPALDTFPLTQRQAQAPANPQDEQETK